MKFSLAGNNLSIDGAVVDWHSLDLSRWNQVYRSGLAEALRHGGAQIRDGVNEGRGVSRSGLAEVRFKLGAELSRSERNACKLALEIIASQIANNSASEGACGGMSWKLEPEPIAKAA